MEDSIVTKWFENSISKKESTCIINKKKICFINNSNDLALLSSSIKYNIIFITKKLNDFHRINQLFIACNKSLEQDGLLVSYIETFHLRKQRLKKKYKLFYPIISLLDILFFRIFPFLSYNLSNYLIRNILPESSLKHRAISKAEILGRLHFCGFEPLEVEENDFLFCIVKKVDKPLNQKNRSYELLFKMNRIGKDGKIIGVYKMRTMYPYSEFIQDYITKTNGLSDTGKIANDYRIPNWGKFFRKFWIDELPMIFNLLNGDLKIYGIRPLSQSYYNKYPKELQQLRNKVKPGLIPPYYYDLPNSFEEILDSEKKYIEVYLKNPIKTDVKYFFVSLWNIFIKGKRSS